MPTIAALILALATLAGAPKDPFTAEYTYVFDGDTIAVRLADDRELRVRYAGIDAPELDAPLGRRAAALNRVLVLDRQVRLRPAVDQSDPYGRLLAYPRVCDLDPEAALLAAGLARPWRYQY